MVSRPLKIILGLIGVLLMATLVIGLSHSISVGFAGFWGGLPFAIIIALVIPMAAYDYWEECVRDHKTPMQQKPNRLS